MSEITLTINDIKVNVPEGTTILDAARSVGIYVPTLCFHPSLPTSKGLEPNEFVYRGEDKTLSDSREEYQGCQLCIVEVDGLNEHQTACNTIVAEDMTVRTDTPELQQQRRTNLFPYLEHHPHACLTCAQKEGCSRTQCSANVPEDERCCPLLGNCELEKLVDYVGLPEGLPKYVPRGMPVLDQEPLFTRDYNLCIGCTRCVRACQELRGVKAIGFARQVAEVVVGSADGPTLAESACKFCTTCVEVCPTGALTDETEVTAANKEEVLVPCAAACPANVDVPRYIRLIADGKYPEAEAVIREQVPFPAVLGRICFRPCEEVCRRAEVNEPVAICNLKRFASDMSIVDLQSSLNRESDTHGNTSHRVPGSIGASADPARVMKNKKMPGHHGNTNHKVLNLQVAKVDAERNYLFVKGAVPGPSSALVAVYKKNKPGDKK